MEAKIHSCPICGTQTKRIDMYRASKACSGKCHKKWIESRHKERLNGFSEMVCLICGTVFKPSNTKQIRCSRECSRLAYRIKAINIINKDFTIFKRDEFRCIYCGKSSIEDNIKLHVEHIVPHCLGGVTDISNLVTSCLKCNLSKSDNRLSASIENRLLFIVKKRNEELLKNQIEQINNEIHLLKTSRPK